MSQSLSSNRKGRILFIPICSPGHINYTIPISKRFLELYGDKGEIYFALNQEYKNKIEKQLPEAKFKIYRDPQEKKAEKVKDHHWIVEVINFFAKYWSPDAVKYVHDSAGDISLLFQDLLEMYPSWTQILDDVKPDLIIFDHLFSLPIGIEQGIPCVNLVSNAMSYTGCHPKMPPPQSGLPTIYTPENAKKWQEFIDKAYKVGPFKKLKDEVSNFLKEHNCPDLSEEYFTFKYSPHLNIYCYPKELDYQEENEIKLPGNWLRIEAPVMKPLPEPFSVPEKLKNLPGKLIYFSLGSLASSYAPFMKKMLEILAELPHRFIVSKGLIGDQYQLADNMYGENYLDQFAVLRVVDIVISHGGNNTLTETFYFGKPLIILPLFSDQPDNAQRIDDKGLGKRLSIFDPPEKLKQDLIDAIEFCSQDSVLLKMKEASERIQKDTGLDKVCEELSKFVIKE